MIDASLALAGSTRIACVSGRKRSNMVELELELRGRGEGSARRGMVASAHSTVHFGGQGNISQE